MLGRVFKVSPSYKKYYRLIGYPIRMKKTFDKGQSAYGKLVVSERIAFPEEEMKVLDYWKKINAFETQLKLTEGKKEYTFYDGPPFATGTPHYGNLLAGTVKVNKDFG